jgi:hypothetical protein
MNLAHHQASNNSNDNRSNYWPVDSLALVSHQAGRWVEHHKRNHMFKYGLFTMTHPAITNTLLLLDRHKEKC